HPLAIIMTHSVPRGRPPTPPATLLFRCGTLSEHGCRIRSRRRRSGIATMALIEDTVGTLPYKLVDFDQHSYEAQDCFTRFMPKDKLDTAVRPIMLPSGHKGLLANERSE